MKESSDKDLLEHLEWLAGHALTGMAAVAFIAFAAATQVWDYPAPRTALGTLGLLLISAALMFMLAKFSAGSPVSQENRNWFRVSVAVSLITFFIGGVISFSALVHFTSVEGGMCFMREKPVCTQKAADLPQP
ncbi:hypothetical protein [Phyllobacterium lublinensis]|uniref:hypothetical protein n=1 Tax=Phyllobacterium lublinensis TaxID=2875708 RepID=UPI001CCBE5F9|nr:hypothetical protein [Phyllobacterium sp. 2063]MBZ9654357.1 hypothetical protein [Phyllobacterium sp. 2063]